MNPRCVTCDYSFGQTELDYKQERHLHIEDHKAKLTEQKREYVDYGSFDGYEAMGLKLMIPIPIMIMIAMDRIFNGTIKDELYRIMTVQEIKFE